MWKGSLASENNWTQASDEIEWSKFEGYEDSGCAWLENKEKEEKEENNSVSDPCEIS